MSLRTEAIAQGLTSGEYDRIVETLGREPNSVELGVFCVMWSEHCCYKSSKIHLKTLPTRGPLVLQGPGENAGIIDIGDGLVLAFKVESHNHPSYIEPFQGAATGVGGILRDIFTMGARPIAVLDSLGFGDPSLPKTAYLLHGVVGGVGSYGNCMGIPTVGGETYFDASYNGNNLVNAMAVGVAPKERLHRAVAKGVGNRVFYLGSKTGRDGIHGATMASQEFGSGNEERRPTVQVGDPFTEKLVMEACLEMMEEKLLVGIQDMGAAGIACSTFEMSARGKSGMEIDLDRVPLRETGLGPYEMFLSESQERMLLVASEDKVPRILEIARKWEIECVDIGVVTDTGRVKATFRGKPVLDLPVLPVTDEAPLYDRPHAAVRPRETSLAPEELPALDVGETLLAMAGSPNLSSRRAIFETYDHTVGTDTVVLPGSDAAVMRIKGTRRGVALTLDSNSRYCAADPYRGTLHVMAECVRNLACVGARGVAVTNCLNFGNPEEPEVMGQLKESIRALGDACRFFETPVTGGNVSLYNQTGEKNIKPTPAIGMVGLMDDGSKSLSAPFKALGSVVALLGIQGDGKIYESEFARFLLRREDLACPPLDLKEEQVLQRTLLQMCGEGILESAHDCSEGGLASALAECCASGKVEEVGVRIAIPGGLPVLPFLFGEYAGRAVISFDPEQRARVELVAKNHGIPFTPLGETVRGFFEVEAHTRIPLRDLAERREAFLRSL